MQSEDSACHRLPGPQGGQTGSMFLFIVPVLPQNNSLLPFLNMREQSLAVKQTCSKSSGRAKVKAAPGSTSSVMPCQLFVFLLFFALLLALTCHPHSDSREQVKRRERACEEDRSVIHHLTWTALGK